MMSFTPKTPITIDQCLTEWHEASVNGDFRKGLAPALRGYELALLAADGLHEKMFLSYLKIATDELHHKLFPQTIGNQDFTVVCSFCNKTITDSPHVLGVNVSICAECIALASRAVNK
jgi:hypothetical protein